MTNIFKIDFKLLYFKFNDFVEVKHMQTTFPKVVFKNKSETEYKYKHKNIYKKRGDYPLFNTFKYYLLDIESTPGNTLPSRYSKEAPPPVEI